MTENEKNLRDLEEWFKMNPTEGAAYAFQKKQLEQEMARESGQAQAATGGTSPIRQEATQASPSLEGGASVETAAPMPVIPKIHITVGGKKIGAFEREEVIRRIRSGEIRRDARVWKDGMPDWVDAGDLPELETYFDEMKGFYAEEERHKREAEQAAARAAEAEEREAEQAAARAAEAEEMYEEAIRYREESFDYDWGDKAKVEPYLAKFRELIVKAAEMGNAEAQALISDYYRTQEFDFPKDPAKAGYWLAKAAEQGHALSQTSLGYYYANANGIGVPRNYTKAVEWYRKAADQGYAQAQWRLGDCYAKGEGVPQNYTNAAEWYRKAAEQGYIEAQIRLGDCYAKGEGVPQNYTKAAEWYRKAAAQEHPLAKNPRAKKKLDALKEQGLIKE